MSADLVAFLQARYDETEAWARAQIEGLPHDFAGDLTPVQAFAMHVLREVEANRAILARHQPYPLDRWQLCGACCAVEHFEFMGPELSAVHWPCPDVRHRTAVYSGHPDYDPEWKP